MEAIDNKGALMIKDRTPSHPEGVTCGWPDTLCRETGRPLLSFQKKTTKDLSRSQEKAFMACQLYLFSIFLVTFWRSNVGFHNMGNHSMSMFFFQKGSPFLCPAALHRHQNLLTKEDKTV